MPVRALVVLCLAASVAAALAPSATPGPGSTVGRRVLRLVDTSRSIRLPDGRRAPRPIVTYVRYPLQGSAPFPLVVFGHGFALTPARYGALLQAWARAGYVVAAPLFPLGNAHAPAGPNESDIVNQPADMRFVISRLSAPAGPLHGLVDASRIAIAGHSDGAETAFATAYETRYRDRRVKAALIFSGAVLPGGGRTYPPGSPPLLAAQGTADTTNPPSSTYGLYGLAPRPKFLLELLGAGHLPPFSEEQPQLGIVERVTIAFLDRYLKNGPLRPLVAAGNVRNVAHLDARP